MEECITFDACSLSRVPIARAITILVPTVKPRTVLINMTLSVEVDPIAPRAFSLPENLPTIALSATLYKRCIIFDTKSESANDR